MALRDLAVTVLELEPDEFHWVLMESVQAESEDCLGYRPIDSSTRGYPDYSEALIQGAIAVRAAQGLASFDRNWHPGGLVVASAAGVLASEPATLAVTRGAASVFTPAGSNASAATGYAPAMRPSGAPETSMMTTTQSVL